MKRFAAVGAVLVVVTSAVAFQSGGTGGWQSYTTMRSVRSVTTSGARAWAATSGGVFLYESASNQFSKFTNTDGLSSNDVTAMTEDREGRLWFGTSEGFINVYDPVEETWMEIRSIAESNRVLKAVRTLAAQNDTMFVGTDFGVVVYLMTRGEFGDTYANFGFLAQPKVNHILVHRNDIWVATESGVARASLSSANLSAPTAWSRYQGTTAASTNMLSLAVFRDTVYAGTSGGVSYFLNGFFIDLPQFNNASVVGIRPSGQTSGDKLYVLRNSGTGFTVEAIGSTTSSAEFVASSTVSSASALGNFPAFGNLWVGTTKQGLARWNGTAWEYHAPNGPQSNLFISLAVDEQGVLWAGSGISDRGEGFYRFNLALPKDRQWKNFVVQDHPVMVFNDYYKVSVGANGSIWVSSWGRGVVEVKNDSVLRRISVPALSSSVGNDSTYVVIGSAVPDASGRTWVANRTAQSRNHLVRLTGESTFEYFAPPGGLLDGYVTNMVIDRNGTKWIANSEPQNKPASGLVLFNEDPTVVSGSAATNGWRVILEPQLPHNNVLSLAVDLDGEVCVGTDEGMVMFNDPRNPTAANRSTTPRATLNQVVQTIAVDAINNKWVGTREGILVLSPDGIQLLQSYTVASTRGKLLSNDIRALAIDPQRGIVYIGTEKGLSSLEIAPVQASRSYTSLEFGPNPYYVPNDGQLMIRNLTANSSIRILSVSGRLVAEFPAQGGGRAFWDGRNSEGEYVASGVYFVVAYAENGTQFTTGKIAVVRR